MALRLVDFAAARVALHRSARSRGYKLSKEGVNPRSLLRGVLCVDVLARCVCCFFVFSSPLDVAPTSPFIVSNKRARILFMVKR
jgi:hypothetical protein